MANRAWTSGCKPTAPPAWPPLRQERSAELAQALARLLANHHEVLILRHLEGLAFPDIAERMERTAGAVQVL